MTAPDKDLGTVRWFGDDWGAPVCDPRAHVNTPIGHSCIRCEIRINAGDQGVTTPYISETPEPGVAVYHLDCFLREVGSPVG